MAIGDDRVARQRLAWQAARLAGRRDLAGPARQAYRDALRFRKEARRWRDGDDGRNGRP